MRSILRVNHQPGLRDCNARYIMVHSMTPLPAEKAGYKAPEWELR